MAGWSVTPHSAIEGMLYVCGRHYTYSDSSLLCVGGAWKGASSTHCKVKLDYYDSGWWS